MTVAAASFGWALLLAGAHARPEVEKMEPMGPLILRCPFKGDRRDDNCSPSGADVQDR